MKPPEGMTLTPVGARWEFAVTVATDGPAVTLEGHAVALVVRVEIDRPQIMP